MTDLDRRAQIHCSRKSMFSYEKALVVAESLRLAEIRSGKKHPNGEPQVYLCSNCGRHHVGHPIRKVEETYETR